MSSLHDSPFIHRRKKTIEFHIRHNCARQIYLSGNFNHWAKDELKLKPSKTGDWKIEIPILPKGRYYYKFLVDDRFWVEDIDNPLREPDGVTGWTSILIVEN